MRNVQLAILSVPLGLCTAFVKDGSKISEHGFLHGYDSFVWFTVAQNALGGLLVAVVVKYADNILKGFATSVSIIVSGLVSWLLLDDLSPGPGFMAGACLVLAASLLYSLPNPQQSSPGRLLPI